MKLAIDQYGKALGRPLAYTVLDTEGKPATAVRKLQESSQQQGTRFFAGGILSSEALAMGKEAEKAGGIFITTAGADEITGKDCNSATFRWSAPTFGAIEHVGTTNGHADRRPDWHAVRQQWLREIFRVLSPGGRMLIGGPNRAFPIDVAHGPDNQAASWERWLARRLGLSANGA